MTIAMIPYNFQVQQGNGQVYLTWNIVSGITGYQVQRSIDGVNFTNLAVPTLNYYLDANVTVNTIYYYQVASVNGFGTSPFTPPQKVIPTLTGEMSLFQVRMLAKYRADMFGSKFRSDPIWNSYINQSYFEIYDLITDTFEDYYMVPQSLLLVTDSLSSSNINMISFPLPTGSNYIGAFTPNIPAPMFYKLRGIDMSLGASGNGFITLSKFQFINRNAYTWNTLVGNFPYGQTYKYRIMGGRIYFIPNALGSQNLFIWYIPRQPELLQDTDIMDGISGWTEYVIIDAAIKSLTEQQLDTSKLERGKMAILKRIEDAAANRDVGEAEKISQRRTSSWSWCNQDGVGGGGF